MDGGDWIALAGVLVGCLIAWIQWYFGKRQGKFYKTIEIISRFQEPEARNSRFMVTALMEKAHNLGGFDKLESLERSQISSVASLFGLAGLLIEKNQIDEDIFLAAYGSSVTINFNRLKEYYIWALDRHKKSADTLWIAFARLAERVEGR